MVAFFTDTMICGFSLYQILAYFLVYSCIGWCLEVIYAAVSTGQLVNRGFLNGPVCPIYGFGMITSSTTPAGGTTAITPSTSAATSALSSRCCGAWAPSS